MEESLNYGDSARNSPTGDECTVTVIQEQVSIEKNWGVAPWYYEQAAIIYRKLDDASAEISILERFMAQRHAPGVGPGELALRLQKAKSRQNN